VSRFLSLPLLRRTLRAQRFRVAIVALAIAIWALLMPVVFATFGRQMAALLDADLIPKPLLRLMGADPFSLNGAVALGWVHPIGLGLQVLLPIGLGAMGIAGERQRGTLEVLLSRPVSRRAFYLTALVSMLGFTVVTVLAAVAGTLAGAALYGVTGDLVLGRLPLLALNTVLLLAALGAISLAASASFDRVGPPLGIGLAVLVVGYLFDVLGTLWPDADFLQPFSPFHYLQPLEILGGRGDERDLLVLLGILVVATAYGLWRFPRRDLAAPT
jgi:ABC-2 type transport system permease protein